MVCLLGYSKQDIARADFYFLLFIYLFTHGDNQQTNNTWHVLMRDVKSLVFMIYGKGSSNWLYYNVYIL